MTISAKDGQPTECPTKLRERTRSRQSRTRRPTADAAPVDMVADRKLRLEARRRRELAARRPEVEALPRTEHVLRPAPAPVAAPPRSMPRPRHYAALAAFLLLVLLPFAATVGYLYTRAADRVPFRRVLLDPLRGGRLGRGGAARRHHPDRNRHRVGARHPVRVHPQPGDRRRDRRRARPAPHLQPGAPGFGLLARGGCRDRGSRPALEPDGGRELREPRRHHPGARQRLHPRGRPGDHPGDPGEVDRAGEPPGRAGAHRRHPLRQGRPRRGRGASARPAPGPRELPPRASDGRPRRRRGRADGAPERAPGRARQGAGRARHAAHLCRAVRPAGAAGEPADHRHLRPHRGRAHHPRRPRHRGEDARGRGRLRGAQGRPRVRLPGLYPGARQPGRSPAPRRAGSRATSRRTWSRRSPRARSIPAGRSCRGWSGSSSSSAGASRCSCTTMCATAAEAAASRRRPGRP